MCHDDLTTTVMAMESWPSSTFERFLNLWQPVFLQISPTVPNLALSSECLDNARDVSIIVSLVWLSRVHQWPSRYELKYAWPVLNWVIVEIGFRSFVAKYRSGSV
jgi:hypothetical protein